MIWLLIIVSALLGYLFGAMPIGLWVCRIYGVDIRQVGSGRIGGTNAWRAAGLKAAIPTVLGDALKGAVAVLLVRALLANLAPTADPVLQATAVALAGGFAVWGHNWSIFIGFGGGAGGMTAAATAMAISPLVGGMVWIAGAILIWWSRMASVGTFTVGTTALGATLVLGIAGYLPWAYLIFGAMAFSGIFVALRVNRERLKQGDERVITLW